MELVAREKIGPDGKETGLYLIDHPFYQERFQGIERNPPQYDAERTFTLVAGIQALFASEIRFKIEVSHTSGYYLASLGIYGTDRFVCASCVPTFIEACEDILRDAIRIYPTSKFAAEWRDRIG